MIKNSVAYSTRYLLLNKSCLKLAFLEHLDKNIAMIGANFVLVMNYGHGMMQMEKGDL